MGSICIEGLAGTGTGMTIAAWLNRGETLGDRIMKVNHAGEHGAVCIYTAQRWFARWRAPDMIAELDHFLDHERQHRAIFGGELRARGRPRCNSYHLCGLGGYVLGGVTGMLGHRAIAATTVAIERVVLEHMREQVSALATEDPAAAAHLRGIIIEEQEHHNRSVDRLNGTTLWSRIIDPVVATSTAVVIWLGMRL